MPTKAQMQERHDGSRLNKFKVKTLKKMLIDSNKKVKAELFFSRVGKMKRAEVVAEILKKFFVLPKGDNRSQIAKKSGRGTKIYTHDKN